METIHTCIGGVADDGIRVCVARKNDGTSILSLAIYTGFFLQQETVNMDSYQPPTSTGEDSASLSGACSISCWLCHPNTTIGYSFFFGHIKKVKAVPLQAWSGPEGSRKLRFPDFM